MSNICVCIYTWVCVCVYVYRYMCVCVWIYIYMCVCGYVYVWNPRRMVWVWYMRILWIVVYVFVILSFVCPSPTNFIPSNVYQTRIKNIHKNEAQQMRWLDERTLNKYRVPTNSIILFTFVLMLYQLCTAKLF